MKQQFIIGVTGHRDVIVTQKLRENVYEYFESKIEEHREKEIILLSPLAEGADSFVAKIFLDLQVKYPQLKLLVPMPFTQQRYLEDFSKESIFEFHQLFQKAYNSFSLSISEHQDAYSALGVYVVENSNELLALWDGTFNTKRGGTGEVVAYAFSQGYKVVHFVCERGDEYRGVV